MTDVKRKRAPLLIHIDREGGHVTLGSVPAWVYSQRGESYFGDAKVDAIQDLIHSVEEKTNAISPAA